MDRFVLRALCSNTVLPISNNIRYKFVFFPHRRGKNCTKLLARKCDLLLTATPLFSQKSALRPKLFSPAISSECYRFYDTPRLLSPSIYMISGSDHGLSTSESFPTPGTILSLALLSFLGNVTKPTIRWGAINLYHLKHGTSLAQQFMERMIKRQEIQNWNQTDQSKV